MKKIIVFVLILSLASCSWPFSKKKDDPAKAPKKTEADTKAKAKKTDEKEPIAGDIKVVDGIEYIYARNRKYMLTPYEPEYVWMRKDQYTAGFGENLLTGGPEGKKEREELEQRLAKLEAELKKKGIAPQMVYPYQMGAMPMGIGYMPGLAMITFNYPSPKMKRKVIVLPLIDETNYKTESLGELATKRLISRLENTGAIICVDPNTTQIKGSFTDPANMKTLNELYGIQAVISGSLSNVYTTSSKVEGKDQSETSFAISKINVDVSNTETANILKRLSGRNPVFLSKEKGDMSTEKAKIKAIDLSIEMIADDLLRAILYLDWHARIASTENGKIYINAGRLSGLDMGSILEVYSPGAELIIDPKTKTPLGKTKGAYKGDLEVVELFGVDACVAKAKKGGNFSATDLVYKKKEQ